MFNSPSIYLVESPVANMESLDIIDSCYAAINEETATSTIVNIASSYTQSTLNEYLEHVRETLMDLYTRVLSYLNNYIFNTAKLADKYRNLIIEKYKKRDKPMLFRTYQYTGLKDKNYPLLMKSSGALINDIRNMQSSFLSSETDTIIAREQIDDMIVEFGRSVVGGDIDPYEINASVERIVSDTIRGREVVKRLDTADLNKFIDEMIQYKAMKDSINATKKNMLSDYAMLKTMLSGEMKRAEASVLGVESMRNPDAALLKNRDYQRFASINISLTRMFNAFIQIYSKAFDTKLQVLNDKITENKEILTKIMVETSVFAAINPMNPERYKRPQKFDPKLKA